MQHASGDADRTPQGILTVLNRLLHYLMLFAPPAAVEELYCAAERRVQGIPAREDLLVPGQQSPHLLLLLEGMACRHSLLSNGRRQITAMLLPGDIVGFDAIPGWRSVDSTTTLTSVQGLRIPAATARAAIESGSALSLMLRGVQELQQAIRREWIVNVGDRLARDRVAHFFCEMVRRARVLGLCSGQTCPLPLSQIELADVTALTPVHVNRVVASLKVHTGATLNRGLLHVPDLRSLERLTGYDPSYLEPVPADCNLHQEEEALRMRIGMDLEAGTLLPTA
jgi:CRP-like cAMP-binding protein